MASVLDVAAYILKEHGPMTAMKLQKLCYYSKAWHLVWDSEQLFPERFEAWANGPVSPELYDKHRGVFMLQKEDSVGGLPNELSPRQRESVNAVLAHYGGMAPHDLSELTHSEAPWREARKDLSEGQRSRATISDTAMYEFYDGLTGKG
jgi:uncharacterized phage-associated protein